LKLSQLQQIISVLREVHQLSLHNTFTLTFIKIAAFASQSIKKAIAFPFGGSLKALRTRNFKTSAIRAQKNLFPGATPMHPSHPLCRTALCALLFLPTLSLAKLSSNSFQIERATQRIDDVFRQNRLNAGEEFWGEGYREEIAQYSEQFGRTYYQVFKELEIHSAMARCAVNARHGSDYQSWLERIDGFDEAIRELDVQDQARYFFAKGMVLLQIVANRTRDIPSAFFEAARLGYPADLLAKQISKMPAADGNDKLYARFGQSYMDGNHLESAYHFYLFSLQQGNCDTELLIRMAECAGNRSNKLLAFKTGLVFNALYSPYDGAGSCRSELLPLIELDSTSSIRDTWLLFSRSGFDTLLVSATQPSKSGAPRREFKERTINRFERQAQRLSLNMGSFASLYYMDLVRLHWQDSSLAVRFMQRIDGGLDEYADEIGALLENVRQDERFNTSADIARWELMLWKRAGREEEFKSSYPERYGLTAR
jgi:hypothetical protein